MIVSGGQLNKGRRGIGFLPSYSTGESGGGGDWWDYGSWFSDYYAPDYGSNWWDNFDPVSGDWGGQGGYQNYNWWDNFDPITGDWIGQGGTLDTIQTVEPGALPKGPTGNWWQNLIDYFKGPVLPNYTPDFSSPVPASPYETPPIVDLPGYCPKGTYHPIDDPFACVPFPPATPGQTSNKKPASPVLGPQSRKAAQKCPQGQVFSQQLNRCIPQCPQGQVFNPQANKCVTAPKCPQGMQFDATKGTCVKVLAQSSAAGLPWWVWLIVAGVGVAALGNDEKTTTRRRKR